MKKCRIALIDKEFGEGPCYVQEFVRVDGKDGMITTPIKEDAFVCNEIHANTFKHKAQRFCFSGRIPEIQFVGE